MPNKICSARSRTNPEEFNFLQTELELELGSNFGQYYCTPLGIGMVH
jgi:hypothetical protein